VLFRSGKVNRAFRRSSDRLLDRVFLKREHFIKRVSDETFIEMIWGTPDHERLNRCFESIVYGLLYHESGQAFQGRLKIFMGHLHYSHPNTAQFSRFIKDRIDIDLQGRPRIGQNPDVFFYQTTLPDSLGLWAIRLCFYGGIEVFVAVIPADKEVPSHLGSLMIRGGMKTIFTLGDREYEFN
jgi:hypothetical protein